MVSACAPTMPDMMLANIVLDPVSHIPDPFRCMITRYTSCLFYCTWHMHAEARLLRTRYLHKHLLTLRA